MYNILLSASGFNWYGFLIGAGMVICIIISYFLAKKRGYDEDLVFYVAIICIPLAIIGARAYYIIFDDFRPGYWTFKRIIGLEGGLSGLAIYGGLIGGAIGGIIVWLIYHKKKDNKISYIQMLDLFFVVIILGQAIGRWGNFANGEAYGNLVTNPKLQFFPYAVKIKTELGIEYHQATFFYEFVLNLIGFGLLFWFYQGNKKSFDGFIFSSYCIWYGTGRFFIEGLRTDSLMVGKIRVSQILSLILILFGIIYIAVHIIRARKAGKRPFIFVPVNKLSYDYFDYEKSRLSKPLPAAKVKRLKTPSKENVKEEFSEEDKNE